MIMISIIKILIIIIIIIIINVIIIVIIITIILESFCWFLKMYDFIHILLANTSQLSYRVQKCKYPFVDLLTESKPTLLSITYLWIQKHASMCYRLQRSRTFVRKSQANKNLSVKSIEITTLT